MTVSTFLGLGLAGASEPCTCETIVSGGYIEDEHWTMMGSPYCVRGDIQIGHLIIDPGVEVLVDGPHVIDVQNRLTAVGSIDQPILFSTCIPGACWRGLTFADAPPTSELAFCIIENSDERGLTLIDSAPTVRDTIIRNNSVSGTGAGVYVENSFEDVTLERCQVLDNEATSHGGGLEVRMTSGTTFHLVDAIVRGNRANTDRRNGNYVGGGIYLYDGNMVIDGGVIESNTVWSKTTSWNATVIAYGGGLSARRSATLHVRNAVLRRNEAFAWDSASGGHEHNYGYGAAIDWGSNGNLTIDNSILSGNDGYIGGSNPGQRGAIYVGGGTADITNTTVARNEEIQAIYRGGGTVTVLNSILFNNYYEGAQVAGAMTITYSDVQGSHDGEGNIRWDPDFVGAGDAPQDLVVSCFSPCVDAGHPDATHADACWPPSCGEPRNDMGAHGGPGGCDWMPYPIRNVNLAKNEAGETVMSWDRSRIADTYSIYEGTIAGFAWTYDHTCHTAALSETSATLLVDPPAAEAFYYLVTARNDLGESHLGWTYADAEAVCGGDMQRQHELRPNIFPCETLDTTGGSPR
jgi:hypothetical protein